MIIRISATIVALGFFAMGCSKQEAAKTAPPSPKAPQTISLPTTAELAPHGTVTKGYGLMGAGILELTFPQNWADSPRRILEGRERVNAITFAPSDGKFGVLLEVRNLGEQAERTFDVRDSLRKAGEVELPNCVEQSLDIHDIEGLEVTGGYYTVTDKRYTDVKPPVGEYKYLTQGYAKLSTLVLKFRLFSNEPPGIERDQTLEMIRSATFRKK